MVWNMCIILICGEDYKEHFNGINTLCYIHINYDRIYEEKNFKTNSLHKSVWYTLHVGIYVRRTSYTYV